MAKSDGKPLREIRRDRDKEAKIIRKMRAEGDGSLEQYDREGLITTSPKL